MCQVRNFKEGTFLELGFTRNGLNVTDWIKWFESRAGEKLDRPLVIWLMIGIQVDLTYIVHMVVFGTPRNRLHSEIKCHLLIYCREDGHSFLVRYNIPEMFTYGYRYIVETFINGLKAHTVTTTKRVPLPQTRSHLERGGLFFQVASLKMFKILWAHDAIPGPPFKEERGQWRTQSLRKWFPSLKYISICAYYDIFTDILMKFRSRLQIDIVVNVGVWLLVTCSSHARKYIC